MVRVLVGLGRVIVLDVHAPDVHGEGALGVVGQTASPLDGTLGVGRITASPDTDSKVHRGLGEPGSALGFVIGKGPDILAINRPCDMILFPFDSVGVEDVLGGLNGMPGRTVVGRGVALAEVVGLDFVVSGTKSLL